MKKCLLLLCVLALGCDRSPDEKTASAGVQPIWHHKTNNHQEVVEIAKDDFDKWVGENPNCYIEQVTGVICPSGYTKSFIVVYRWMGF